MNWSLFFATITWSIAVVSVITGVIAMMALGPDMPCSVKKCLCVLFVPLAVLVLCIALIAGMGWNPPS